MERIQRYRRDLHQIPELDHALPKTLSYIKEQLQAYRCQLVVPSRSALCAYFDFGQASTLAFRTDMDALQIKEQTHHAYRSKHKGMMHACGHDGHMAMLLEFAAVVQELSTCRYNVLLMFQPAEETTGGAKEIIDSGILTKHHVKHVFGFHLWPQLPLGTIASKPNAFMAKSSEISIEIKGKAAHAAKAQEGNDALYAAVSFLHQAYQMEQQLPASNLRLLKFGKLESGTMRNVISAHTNILGTMRAFDPAVFHHMETSLYQIAKEVEHLTGCSFSFHISNGYPPLINDPELFEQCRNCIGDLQELREPSMLAEDFSFYGNAVPSLFLYLGIGDTPALHASNFDFDDAVLSKGVKVYQQLLQL